MAMGDLKMADFRPKAKKSLACQGLSGCLGEQGDLFYFGGPDGNPRSHRHLTKGNIRQTI